jgi:hypothetical protein
MTSNVDVAMEIFEAWHQMTLHTSNHVAPMCTKELEKMTTKRRWQPTWLLPFLQCAQTNWRRRQQFSKTKATWHFLQFMNIDYTLMKLKHISSFASQRSFKSYSLAIDYHLACNITNHTDYNPFTICWSSNWTSKQCNGKNDKRHYHWNPRDKHYKANPI